MLKFTAELSEQFRRASSVSSLKAYHIAKSANKPTYTNFSMPKHRPQLNNHHHRIYDPPLATTDYHTCQHQFYRSTHKPIQTSYKPRVPDCTPSHSSTCPPQKFHHPRRERHEHWSTPQRMHCEPNNYTRKQPSTTNSVTNFYQTCKNEKKSEITVKPQPTLSELNTNSIKIEEDSKIRKLVNSAFPHGNQNESTVRKASSYLQKANNAAKMRISSINSLENIQKRIQATLGHQNQLRI